MDCKVTMHSIPHFSAGSARGKKLPKELAVKKIGAAESMPNNAAYDVLF